MSCDELSGTVVEVYRGESRTLRLEVVDDARDPVDLTGYTVRFTLKRRVKDTHVVLELVSTTPTEIEILVPEADGFANIYLDADTMNNIPVGQYVFDIWLETAPDTRFPVVLPSIFEVKGPVTTYA
jgi:hypothetical protein